MTGERIGRCGHQLTGQQRVWCSDECQRAAAREGWLRTVYDISPEEYDRILAEQGGHCGICPKKPAPGKSLAVDHDHKTGLVRGLLCFMCNKRVLGARSADVLVRTAAYVTSPPAERVIGKRVAPGRPKKKRAVRRRTPRKAAT
jgi:hypothetical protein